MEGEEEPEAGGGGGRAELLPPHRLCASCGLRRAEPVAAAPGDLSPAGAGFPTSARSCSCELLPCSAARPAWPNLTQRSQHLPAELDSAPHHLQLSLTLRSHYFPAEPDTAPASPHG